MNECGGKVRRVGGDENVRRGMHFANRRERVAEPLAQVRAALRNDLKTFRQFNRVRQQFANRRFRVGRIDAENAADSWIKRPCETLRQIKQKRLGQLCRAVYPKRW